MIHTFGKLYLDPIPLTKKHLKQNWKKTGVILLKDDTADYYDWFLRKRYNLILNKPLRGSHVTIINEIVKEENYVKILNEYNNQIVNFSYDIVPKSNGKHWWLKVYSKEIEEIRVKCGLRPTPYFSLHLTIGLVNEKNRFHSDYIIRMSKKFEPI